MTDKQRILVVDDEEINRIILKEMLSDDYEVHFENDGKSCLQRLENHTPDLILLDVNMPDLSGLEVCQTLRKNSALENIPVIFVSALTSDDDRIAGYEAGGDDYVTKPFHEDELLKKISLLLIQQTTKIALQDQAKGATEALMITLTSTGELGVIIHFLKKSYDCKNLDELHTLVFNTLKEFDLNSSLMITAFGEPIVTFSDDRERPLERIVLQKMHQGGKIITFGQRTIFNTPNLSLLVRNMPEDQELTGRYRDHLAIFIDGLESRLLGIKQEMTVLERESDLTQIVKATQQSLENIDQQHKQQRIKSAQILSHMGQDIEESFLTLGLSEAQEETLLSLVGQTEKQTDLLFEDGLKTDNELNDIMLKLNSSLTS